MIPFVSGVGRNPAEAKLTVVATLIKSLLQSNYPGYERFPIRVEHQEE